MDAHVRFDGSYHLSEGVMCKQLVNSSPYELLKIEDAAERIFNGNRIKRVYISNKEYGLPFLSSSDILCTDLDNVKYASRRYTSSIEDMTLGEGWTLITRSGTIGNCAYTNKQHAQKLASEDVIRLIPNNILKGGYVYAYLASKYGYAMLTQGTFGGVIQHIEPDFVGSIPIPKLPKNFQSEVDDLVKKSATLRSDATELLKEAEILLKSEASLKDLTPEDYDYFGPRTYKRQVSCFVRERKDVNVVTINAFNYSERIRNTKQMISCTTLPLKDVLLNGDVFSTGSFPRVEVKGENGVMLINQSDIFDTIIKGKYISKRNVRLSNLVEYGEVLIAGVGTLGENESFCRVIYANEGLVNQLVSGEFIRMKTSAVPSGYLFAWLNTDYGFRFIRNTQAGTKLCRPIPKLLLEIPVPIIAKDKMEEIDRMVREAHTMRYQANQKELKAIAMVEAEIEKWKN